VADLHPPAGVIGGALMAPLASSAAASSGSEG